MKLVIFPAMSQNEEAQVRAQAGANVVVNAPSEAAAEQAMNDADAFYGTITPPLLAAAGKLRWIQASRAGMEHYLFPELVARTDITLTNMAGIYNEPIADHAFGLVLAFANGFHVAFRNQARRVWDEAVPRVFLPEATLGVIGLGGIGTEVARRGKTSGMTVIATDARRTDRPPFVDELLPASGLPDLLARSDFVVICAPHTPETEGMIRRPQLETMKKTAYLINIGRGVIVSLVDLTVALEQGTIAGAGLDVFETEPLPADHPLWGRENVLLTPHTAGMSPKSSARRLAVLLENLRRFRAGEPLKNVVDKNQWF